MIKTIDARGKACPLPIVEAVKTLAHLQAGDLLRVTVDNDTAVQNLNKMARQRRCGFSSEQRDAAWYLVTLEVMQETSGTNGGTPCASDAELMTAAKGERIVVLSSDRMGEGDADLGRILIKGFLYALTEQEVLPETLILYNSGVRLAVQDSEALADLQQLEAVGVEVSACGTCLNHYGLTEKLAVGSVTNMYAIAEKLLKSASVIKP
ncbi:MAG: sulfurtransferase-like selenium metabolism protein YedF [Clostridiales Family XIII bacterium]|jgi:selenium metabolism protein YedF|nr:sulfurtransferase-like selenium metabolism protein YedF [Clostridiales Family XIII bacterium]